MYLYYGLILTIFLEYVRPGQFFPIINTVKIGTVLPLFLFLASLFAKTNTTHNDVWESSTTRWLVFYLFLILVSAFTSDVTFYAYTKFTQVLGYFFLFYIICRFVDDFSKLKVFMLTMCGVHALLLAINPKLLLNPQQRHYLEGAPFLGDGNDFSLSLCIVFPMCLFLWMDASTKTKKFLFLGLLLVLGLGIIGTQSRGASLALAGILFYLWWQGKNKIIGVIAIGILGFAVLLFAPPEYFARMNTLKNYEEDGSAKGRLDAWADATEMALENPILGIGAGHFGAKHGLSAHSMYFLAFAELGFPGVIFLFFYLYTMYKRNARWVKHFGKDPPAETARYRKLFLCMNGTLVGFIIAATFLGVLYYPHLFVIGGVMLVANRIGVEFQESNASNTELDLKREKYGLDTDNQQNNIGTYSKYY